MAGIIVEELGQLEEENQALKFLALLTHLEVRKAYREIEALSLEHDGLIEDFEALKKRHGLLREKAQKLKRKKTALKLELAGTKEEHSQVASECKRLWDWHADVQRDLEKREEELQSARRGLLMLWEQKNQMA